MECVKVKIHNFISDQYKVLPDDIQDLSPIFAKFTFDTIQSNPS